MAKKRLLALLLACAMLFTSVPTEVFAQAVAQETADFAEDSGDTAESNDEGTVETEVSDATEITDDEEASDAEMKQDSEISEASSEQEVVSVQSEITDFTYTVLNGTYCQVTGYTGTETEITIPSEIEGYIVQSLKDNAFKGNKTLEQVVFPEMLETMGSGTFEGCTALTSVSLNETLISVGNNSFKGCISLTGITIPESIQSIGNEAFNGCTSLSEITLPENVKSIGGNAFNGCQALSTVNLSEGLTTIYAYAFQNCHNLKNIDLPGSVTTISARAFYNCTNLSEIAYPSGWTKVLSYYNDDRNDGNSLNTSPFEGCTSLKKIEIPEGVTAIPKHAFRYVRSLSEVVLPDSLQSIGAYAFDNAGFETLTLPENLESIGNYAFSGCGSLKSVAMQDNVKTIGSYAFNECPVLTEVKLSEGLTALEGYAFRKCPALQSITIPEQITVLNSYVFEECTALTEVALPENMTAIYAYAFYNCSSLERINIPDSVTTMSARAFYNCTKLSEVDYPSGWTRLLSYYNDDRNDGNSLNTSPFEGCTSLKKIEIPEGVTAIPKHAFRYVRSLSEVILPDSLQSIGAYAFDNAGFITITLPENLESIGNYAFSGCTSLRTLALPESLTALGEYAFSECTGLRSVTILSQLERLNSYVFNSCTGLTEVALPENMTAIYAYAFYNCSSLERINIPDSVTTMSARAFYNCTKLAEIGYPSGWTRLLSYYNDDRNDGNSLNTSPFEGCTSLKKIEIPEGVTAIPKHAFRYVRSLSEVILPDSLQSIGAYAFDNAGFITITLPENLESIGNYAFSGCTSLRTLALPESLTALGEYAFSECTGLRSVTILSQLERLNSYVFNSCTGLTEVTLPERLTTIYAYAFYNCSSLERINIPDSVTTMSARAFYNCTKLAEIGYPSGWTRLLSYYNDDRNDGNSLNTSPFEGCTSLKKIEIPEGVTALPKHAFRYVRSLSEVVLPESLTSIGVYAFDNCTLLKKVWISQNVTVIGNNAFTNCAGLTIHGIEGSYAQEYAGQNGIPFSTEPLVYPSVEISGTVQTAEGKGVSGVTVTLYDVTNKEVQETVLTDKNGAWNSPKAIIGHVYQVWFYHTDYEIVNDTKNYIIGEEAVTVPEVTVKMKGAVLETPAEEFTYTALNGTYCRITGYTGSETAIRLPEEIDGHIVQSVGDNAFKGNRTLERVIFPKTAEAMGNSVFEGCTALKDVSLNEGLTGLGDYALKGCVALTKISIPGSVRTIGNEAFNGCITLSEITLSGNVQSIGGNAFNGCGVLNRVNLSEGLTTIYAYAFQNCHNLKNIDLPDSVTTISARAFYNCTNLSEIAYPSGWTKVLSYYNDDRNDGNSLNTSPFEGCTSLKKIEIPEGVTAIPKHAFRYVRSLSEVVLPDSLQSIGAYAFDNAGFETLTLPENLESIGNYAFSGCGSLKSVAMQDNVKTIGSYAFNECPVLTEVKLSEGLTALEGYAFRKCPAPQSITIPEQITVLNSYVFEECTALTEVALPENMTAIYAYAFYNCSSLERINIPDSVTTMSARAFYNCTKLSEVDYPSGWTRLLSYYNDDRNDGNSLNTSPFEGCTSLKKIEIPEGVTAIPKHAFRYVRSLSEVILPDSLQSIGAYAFDNAGFITITLPENLESIGNYAFSGCTSLRTLALPESLTALGEYAFSECTGLRSVTILSQLERLNSYVFNSCTGLTEVTLPERLTTIYAYAFYNCSSLERINIPDSVTTMSARAFYNCTKLAEIGYPSGWTRLLSYYNDDRNDGNSLNTSPFEGCTSLKKIEIPEGVTALPKHAFRYVRSLSEVVLPESLTSIGVYAFDNCTLLKKVWISQNVTVIGNNAFTNCAGLTIHGIEGSYAQEYAGQNGIPFSTEPLVYPSVEISGTVQTAEGKGVSGVTVTLYDVTNKEVQETVLTDKNGAWNSPKAIIGHVYQVWFYHTDYEIVNDTKNYIIGEEAVTVPEVTVKMKGAVLETPAEEFTYTALNGTYCRITGYTGSETAIRLPEEIDGHIVQSVGDNAFKGNRTLERVIFPKTAEAMGNSVFEGCTALKDVSLNEGLTGLGDYALKGCVALTKISIPGSVRTIGNEAFNGCITLSEITLSGNVQSIGGNAFNGCGVLNRVNLSEGLTTIYAYAFQNCHNLKNINLPDSVTTISARAFYNCTNLSEIAYPSGWTKVLSYYNDDRNDGNSLNTSPFEGCTSLKKIEIPEGVTAIPKHAFRYVRSLSEVVLPDSLQSIGAYAFDNAGFETLTLPENLESIGNYAFSGCGSLKSVAMQDNVKTIGSYAFNECPVLTEVKLSEGLTALEGYAFRKCPALQSITIPEQITVLNSYVFEECTALTEVALPENMTAIYAYAFYNCSSMERINIPDSVTTMSARAFYNCTKLSEVDYPSGWTRLLSYYNDDRNDGNSLNTSPFEGCTSLKKIEIPEGVTAIPKHAFRYQTALQEVVLPDSLTNIGVYAFDGCSSLRTINLVEGLTSIPAYAFTNCTSMNVLTLPSGITSVGNYAFYGCKGLRLINMDENLETIGSYAFYGCAGLVSLVLNEGLKTISDNAFVNCINLTAVEVPKSVTAMAGNSFNGCGKLMVYCYSGSAAHITSESAGYRFSLLDEHEHIYETTVETAATCLRGGSQIKTCSICGYNYIELLNPLGHDYDSKDVLPTCTDKGYTEHTCSRCDDTYRDSYVDALGHTYGEWETVKETSCTTNGIQKHICEVCGSEETKVIPAPGHIYEEVVVPPTCTGQGCTVYTCSVCNESYGDHYVDELKHNFGKWEVTKEATILECGVRTRTCSVCSKEETEEIAKAVVDVENNSQYGLANFTVLDAMSLKPVSGASIFITTENDGEATLITDERGQISQILPVGQWPVSVYADGYLVRNLKIKVEAGEQEIPPIGISDKPLVDASITTKEMTYEEMVEAGIDVENSENKHFYKYEVEIRFHETLDILSFVSYGDGEGHIIATVPNNSSGDTSKTVHALSHDGDAVEAEPVTVIYSAKYGTYISDRSTFANAVWSPTLGGKIDFVNNGYHFEGYGIPSTLTMTTDRAFPNTGWTYNSQSGRLSMTVGKRTHYLTFRNGEFCTVANSKDSIAIHLFEKIPAEGYPTKTDYVYVPADTFEAGKQYLLLQFDSSGIDRREALSHDADQSAHETVTIHRDDVYGEYIADSSLYENAVWLSSPAKKDGLKIANHYYFAQVEDETLKYMPLASEAGWKLDGEYLTTMMGDKTFYLRYGSEGYHVMSDEKYAGKVMIFEKTTATDYVSGSGKTETKTIYKRVDSFEAGKEYIIVGSGRTPGSNGGGGISDEKDKYTGPNRESVTTILPDGTPVTIYPVSEQFYLIIYGEVCWLKEMFDVEMLVLNNSSTDTIENCAAELILPEGLSLATMVEGEQSAVQTIDHIPENGSHSLHWYVRGDKEGSYNITATLSGTMMPFEEEFFYEYEAESPIKVYAGNAMKMTFYIPEAAYKNQDYVVRFELENVSDKVLYGVTHTITGWEQGKITYYSDGSEVFEKYGSGGTLGSMGVDAFYPGDKIVIEVSFDILFESSIIKGLLGSVDQAENLYNSYRAVKVAYDLLTGLTGFCGSASKSLDGIIKAGKVTDAEKLKAVNSLLSAINKLYGKFKKGDSEAIKLSNNIQSSEAYKKIKSCANDLDWEAFVMAETVENILELADKIESSVSGKESTEKPFNAFDSFRTMISNLPIRFVVDSVRVKTLEGSTTSIPYSIELTPVAAPYMGVDNWGKYIYNNLIISMGKISSPWYAQILGASDDVTGYDESVVYVKQVESQIAAYSVHKGSGTKFEAWIEKASSANVGRIASSSASSDGSFLLETDNETAAYDENGKLTFTGNAVLEVTALSGENGTLYIKDDEGNVKTIVIDVVEPHTCHSDTWLVEVAPSEEHDGYRAKCCDICGDTIAVEILTACSEHHFGDWIVEQKATAEVMGIRYRECQNCYARETEYLPTEEKADIYTVTVNGEVFKQAEYNTKVTIEAEIPVSGQKFVGWKVTGRDEIISTSRIYSFYIAGDISLETCYVAEEEIVEQKPAALLSNVIVTDNAAGGKKDMKFVAQLVVPEGYTLESVGLVWSNKGRGYATEEYLNLDMVGQPGVKLTTISKISNTYQFSVTIKGVPDAIEVPGRIFATFKNDMGTIYSEVVIGNEQ